VRRIETIRLSSVSDPASVSDSPNSPVIASSRRAWTARKSYQDPLHTVGASEVALSLVSDNNTRAAIRWAVKSERPYDRVCTVEVTD
jgi:hypothetical protein